MSKVYRGLIEVCWALGLIALVAVIVLRLRPSLQLTFGVSPRSGMLMAAAFFLCVLATSVVEKLRPSS